MVRTALVCLLPGAAAFKHLAASTSGLDADRILCPVLASLYNSGDLRVDADGNSELEEIKAALMGGTGCGSAFADFQAAGIADYTEEQKNIEETRDRCVPLSFKGTACAAKRAVGSKSESVKRWLNIFAMNGNENVEHAFSTGVRGGATNVPDFDDGCHGVYPCEARFQKFYARHADANGRLYRDNVVQIICHAAAEGDRGGEFSYSSALTRVPGLDIEAPGQEWQMKAAMLGWLTAFGRTDSAGELYLTVDDARSMLMEGRFPAGWQKRDWGCLFSGCTPSFLEAINYELPCSVTPWWQGTSCEASTGETCGTFSSCSDPNAVCISGQCICGKGSDGLSMCFDGGSCQARADGCSYAGGACRRKRADNPSSEGWVADAVAVAANATVTLV